MGILSQEELDKVWGEQGLKYRIKRFHGFLVERGLLEVAVPLYLFEDHIRNDILGRFFVKGVKENPDGRQEYKPDGRSEDENETGAPRPTAGSGSE